MGIKRVRLNSQQQQQRSSKPANLRRFPSSEDLSYPDLSNCRRRAFRTTPSTATSSSLNSSTANADTSTSATSITNRPAIHPAQRQGSVATIRPIVSHEKQKELDQLAVSVHYLKTQFWEEVRKAGHKRSTPIYEIENLSGSPGVIRQKGQQVICPVDGKQGAAYVHCIRKSKDFVGKATYMLSYSWRLVKRNQHWKMETGVWI